MATTIHPATAPSLDLDRIRADFPILDREVGGPPLPSRDAAATAHKPSQGRDAGDGDDRRSNANVHRGVHQLGNEATDRVEASRVRVAGFIDADPQGLVFVRNTTEALNLVAGSYA